MRTIRLPVKSSKARAVVWVVDDVEANHALVRRSLPAGFEGACELVSHLSATAALEALRSGLAGAAAGDGAALPDVIFLDFFLGDGYGNEVAREVRAAFSSRGLAGPFIVGHSSSPPASLEIVRAGGDVAIEKDRHAAASPGVKRLFPDVAAVRRYAGRARKPARPPKS